ncbi:MAG: winged helix-turn-helix domain-containing protein [Proteobacteria bacterium]|nr:winged helix-turn-helix domain-containing protein [Pseudomonadota bacterium]
MNMLGVVGERRNIGITLNIIDSRLILSIGQPETLAGINIGHAGTGKSSSMKKPLSLCPDEQIITLTSATAKSFFNRGSELSHKVLILEEASELKFDGEFVKVFRVLLSEGRATHCRTARIGADLYTATLTVEGPIAFLSTTNTPKLEAQIADRSITISPDKSEAQTRRIMKAQALRAAGDQPHLTEQDIKLWQDFHGSLLPCQVVVPYAPKICEHLSQGRYALCARRAFPRFLSAIKAITILYQHQRERDAADRLIADMADYAMAYQLFSSTFLQDTDPGICELTEQRLEIVRADGKITMSSLAEREGISRQAIHEWAKALLEAGKLFWCDSEGNPFRTRVLENRAKKNGTAFLRCVTPAALPSPYDLTGDSAWFEGGELFELYDLDLEGVNAPVSYDQSGTSVDYEKIPVCTEIPHTTAQNALMLYRPAV